MRYLIFAFITALSVVITACDVNEGGAEEAGESIDEVMTDTGNKVEDLCEDAKQTMNADNENC
ncbi:MAG: hypothetical protein CMK83_09540 [Pseudomonadales bacterium]|jgi:membrane protein involved in colicin uptake|uniref:hypothetical protein n=1 Tax=unclassified Ketobacter TaxID=2639109 RepID=UPI000C43717A|nr:MULTISPECIES: hypothetical protein [unclassified Ketobacter]MAA59082.1 hypothetical protein [Pseudomonadales bacterium]MEC8812907.1 hypothetical protein [Pseudomonadota bacterium]TNC88073.1 MAG: hypothetical protein CSH49_13245 [Alcanivorax sp.]HAG95831.1 hypothetical protein [Gammaproteobacteria bacterium]MAQ24453.1 hypothetical protein [Pseudomonadales bacterium]|tara:strand:+ start:6768 stop:6956 length:189 start_codon:yes stop_codon:yes gene_type:complete